MSRILRASALSAAAALAVVTTAAVPAQAAAVGYVRLAHLSPDTPAVDVYLAAVDGSSPKKFPAVGYGVVSQYLPLSEGTYAVAMRGAGAAESTPPVLSTQVTVASGGAYTVAGVGRNAELGLKVIGDDLGLPSAGKAKVRVVQASVKAPVIDVSTSSGTVIASGAAFATTTPYQEVNPGAWKLKLQPQGSAAATEVAADCAAGGVYSVLVLDGKDGGLTVEVRTDAKGGAVVPAGGVDTGAGGTAHNRTLLMSVQVALAVLVVAGLGAWLVRRRRGTVV
jgi:hypothetical protein